MGHNFDGRAYARAATHQKEWGVALIDELHLRGNERVLDLGCGDGELTARIADRVPEGAVVGIDSSPGMIAEALAHERPNLRFIEMDMCDLRLSEGFDVVFSNAALHWLGDHRPLYARLRPILHSGARLRFAFAGEGNCRNFVAVARAVMSADAYRAYFTGFQWPWFMPDAHEYSRLVNACGFSKVLVWAERADRHFADAEAITGWIEQPSLVPFLEHLPDRIASRFHDDVIARTLEQTAQPDGGYFEEFRRLHVAAVA